MEEEKLSDFVNLIAEPQEKPTLFKRLALRFLKICLHIPILGYYMRSSFAFTCFFANFLHRIGDYKYLYKYLTKVLERGYYRSEKKQNCWWFLMRLMISFLQEQQIRHLIVNPELEESLIELGTNFNCERVGYNVSYSYIGFALWLFERALIEEAIEMAAIAAEADDQWGYPEYLLGWFNLFLGGQESITHFRKAVEIDWNFLHRIKKDRTCQQFPDLIKQVGQEVIVMDKYNSN